MGKLANIFKRFKKGDPLAKAVNQDDFDKVYNILEDTEGEGCDIERNNPNGKGWIIRVHPAEGDADGDTAAVKSASVTVAQEPEDDEGGSGDEDGSEVRNVISLKGFAGEEPVTGEDFHSENSDVLIRDRTDEDKPELKYVPTTEITKADTEAEETQLSRSIAHNENGELTLKGFQSESTVAGDDLDRDRCHVLLRDNDETPELKYATVDEITKTDSEATNPNSMSIVHNGDEELALRNFDSDATETLAKTTSGRTPYHLLVKYKTKHQLEYIPLDDAVLVDSEYQGTDSKSVEKGTKGLCLYHFKSPSGGKIDKGNKDDYYVFCRGTSGNVLLQRKLDFTSEKTDADGSTSKSVERNTNDELSLYHFTDPSGGTIDKDNKDSYYVFCRNVNGTTLLQKKLDFGSGSGDDDDDDNGYTGNVDVVTDVTYSASTHRLEKKVRTFVIENGRITNVRSASTSLIDQAVEETV